MLKNCCCWLIAQCAASRNYYKAFKVASSIFLSIEISARLIKIVDNDESGKDNNESVAGFRKWNRMEFSVDSEIWLSLSTWKSWYLQEQPVMLAIVGGSFCSFVDRCFEDTGGPRKCRYQGRCKRLAACWSFLMSTQRHRTIIYAPPFFFLLLSFLSLSVKYTSECFHFISCRLLIN